MKIAIITINDMHNYGNRLQNYAVQYLLKKMDCDSFNIVDSTYFFDFRRKKILNEIKKVIKNPQKEYLRKKKDRNFRAFNQNMCYDDLLKGVKVLFEEQVKSYEYIIVGSDQVWNPDFAVSAVTLLTNIPSNKCVSFSASFGVESIPCCKHKEYRDELKKFKALSVREEAGAKIIKDITGRDATVLVDPTMLLTQEEWRKVSKKPRGAKEGYILTYFLSPKCDEAKTKLEDIRGNKEVYELLNPDDKVARTAGPSEFLWLFDHADMILTDSFHACVFSFLFHKPFIVYDRNWDQGNMNSRLETLLSKFYLERKYATSGLENDIWEHDYSEGYKQLKIERKKSIDFLKKALED